MDLGELIVAIDSERKEFNERIRSKADTLNFHDITREIKFNPADEIYEKFKFGENLKLELSKGEFRLDLSPEMAILNGYGIDIKNFQGKHINAYYTYLAASIESVDRSEVPF